MTTYLVLTCSRMCMSSPRHDALVQYEAALFCGDFNFDSTKNFGDWRPRAISLHAFAMATADAKAPQSAALAGHPDSKEDGTNLENKVLGKVLPEYTDCWSVLRPTEAGHTFDGSSNPHVHDAQERMRYDRVLVRGMAPVAISMLGERPAAGKGDAATVREGKTAPEALAASCPPSDHYGLCATVQFMRS